MTLIKKTKAAEPEEQPEQPVKKEMTLEESEAYYKVSFEKMMAQFKKTNKMIEDINANLRTLIDTDKQVHEKVEPEPAAPDTTGADGEDHNKDLTDKIEEQK